MSYKLKQGAIQGFSERAAGAICDRFYAEKKRADGPVLMKFTESEQVNAFLVQTLFEKWQEETLRLQSPYFDFDHELVKEALKTFMNKLSEHISVARQDLQPLLAEAIADTVLITFDPVAYVQKRAADSGRLILKYIKTRKASFKQLKSLSDISPADFDEEPPVEPKAFVTALGMDTKALFEEESLSFFDRHEAEEERELSVESGAVMETVPEPKVEKLVQKEVVSETLNDRLNPGTKPETLADKLKKGQKKRLEDSLNLNEKFMFTNALFSGDKQRMSEALADLDQAESHDEAKMKAIKYSESWDMENEEVEAFFDLIERRFA